jgi:hypothetical protein
MHDPLVEINVASLTKLISATPFSLSQFEQLIGWSFTHRDAPASKRALAWAVLQLPKDDLTRLKSWQEAFPILWISRVEDVDIILGGNSNVVPIRYNGQP